MTNTISALLAEATDALTRAGVESPQLDSQLLLATALNVTRLDLITHPERTISEQEQSAFRAMLAARLARRPLAYLTGSREFYGLSIDVSEAVLVPRPETELLVEETIKRVGVGAVRIADVGVGSGAIVVALGMNLPDALLLGTDISAAALEVAGRNVAKLHLSDRVTLLEGDLVEPLWPIRAEFDAIVSNPPYVPQDDIPGLQPEVSRWEPREALDGGPDGLDVIRRLLPAARELLKPGAFVALEIGAGQAEEVARIAESAGYARWEAMRDLARIERVVVCHK